MIGFYDLARDRLTARCPSLVQVATGIDAQVAAEMLALGAAVTALVTPLSDEATPIREAGLRVSQNETHVFGVTLAMVFPAGFAEFEVARKEIKDALRGWLAPGLGKAVEYAGGKTLTYDLRADGGRWLHLLRFRFSLPTTYEVST